MLFTLKNKPLPPHTLHQVNHNMHLINEVISACAGLDRKLHYMHSVHNEESIDEAAFQSRPLSEHFITNFVTENHPIFECVIL